MILSWHQSWDQDPSLKCCYDDNAFVWIQNMDIVPKLNRLFETCTAELLKGHLQNYIPRLSDKLPSLGIGQCKRHWSDTMQVVNALGWAGHLKRMEDTHILKQLLFGKCKFGVRSIGRLLLRWKGHLKSNFRHVHTNGSTGQMISLERLNLWAPLRKAEITMNEILKQKNEEKGRRRHNRNGKPAAH